MASSGKNEMGQDNENRIWERDECDDLGVFDDELTLQTSSITQGAQSLDENSSEYLQNSSDIEQESGGSQDTDSVTFQSDKEWWPSVQSKKRGRKMVLISVLDEETKRLPVRPTESKSAPTSPSSLPTPAKSVVSEESFDHRIEAFQTLLGNIPHPKPFTIWRRSYSDSHTPNYIADLPQQKYGTSSFDSHVWKRTKLVPDTTNNNNRSLSWSSDEEEPISIATLSKRATANGLNWPTKPKNLGQTATDCLFQTKGDCDKFSPPPTTLQSQQGKKNYPYPVPGKPAACIRSVYLKQEKKPETVNNDTPFQLAQAVYGMKIAQIEGYSELYRAMQFSSTILTHASVFCKTLQFFRHHGGIPCKVDIGYRYFVNEKEYIPERGLLPGICTFNDPFAFFPHEHRGNVRGQLVARLAGNLHTATTIISYLKESDAATYTAVEMPLRRSTVQILSSSDQCLPLLHFDSHVVLDLYDNESVGNLVLHTYHQRLQRELDQIFNDGILTKVPFHLPSEHPDFQPI